MGGPESRDGGPEGGEGLDRGDGFEDLVPPDPESPLDGELVEEGGLSGEQQTSRLEAARAALHNVGRTALPPGNESTLSSEHTVRSSPDGGNGGDGDTPGRGEVVEFVHHTRRLPTEEQLAEARERRARETAEAERDAAGDDARLEDIAAAEGLAHEEHARREKIAEIIKGYDDQFRRGHAEATGKLARLKKVVIDNPENAELMEAVRKRYGVEEALVIERFSQQPGEPSAPHEDVWPKSVEDWMPWISGWQVPLRAAKKGWRGLRHARSNRDPHDPFYVRRLSVGPTGPNGEQMVLDEEFKQERRGLLGTLKNDPVEHTLVRAELVSFPGGVDKKLKKEKAKVEAARGVWTKGSISKPGAFDVTVEGGKKKFKPTEAMEFYLTLPEVGMDRWEPAGGPVLSAEAGILPASHGGFVVHEHGRSAAQRYADPGGRSAEEIDRGIEALNDMGIYTSVQEEAMERVAVDGTLEGDGRNLRAAGDRDDGIVDAELVPQGALGSGAEGHADDVIDGEVVDEPAPSGLSFEDYAGRLAAIERVTQPGTVQRLGHLETLRDEQVVNREDPRWLEVWGRLNDEIDDLRVALSVDSEPPPALLVPGQHPRKKSQREVRIEEILKRRRAAQQRPAPAPAAPTVSVSPETAPVASSAPLAAGEASVAAEPVVRPEPVRPDRGPDAGRPMEVVRPVSSAGSPGGGGGGGESRAPATERVNAPDVVWPSVDADALPGTGEPDISSVIAERAGLEFAPTGLPPFDQIDRVAHAARTVEELDALIAFVQERGRDSREVAAKERRARLGGADSGSDERDMRRKRVLIARLSKQKGTLREQQRAASRAARAASTTAAAVAPGVPASPGLDSGGAQGSPLAPAEELPHGEPDIQSADIPRAPTGSPLAQADELLHGEDDMQSADVPREPTVRRSHRKSH